MEHVRPGAALAALLGNDSVRRVLDGVDSNVLKGENNHAD